MQFEEIAGEHMLQEMTYFAVFTSVAMAVVIVALGLSKTLQTRRPEEGKLRPYECGNIVEGDPRIQFKLRYYVFALLLIVFDIEMLFIIPWAVVFKSLGMFALIEMIIFAAILALAFIYAWRKGDLEWI